MAEEGTRQRQYRGAMATFISCVAIAFSIYHVLYITNTLSRLGVYFDIPVHLAVHLGTMLVLVFLLFPASKRASRSRLAWWDILLVLVGFGWNFYMVFNFSNIYIRHQTGGPLLLPEQVFAWVNMLVVFEACRRTMGPAVASIGVIFLAYPLFASFLPGVFAAPTFSMDRIARGIGLFVTGMYGNILNISATLVFSYILFAQFLNASGAGQWFVDVAQSLLGHVRGGPAKVAVVASSLMGMIQGSGTTNVATIGVFTIPLMKKTGYRAHFAAAIETVASNGGQIMPPVMGIAAFIMMDFLGVGYERIMLAAILPAILYYVAVYFQVDFEAAREGLLGIPRDQLPPLWKTTIRGWPYVLPISALVFFLIFLNYSPQLSALYSAGLLVVVSFFNRKTRITLRRFIQALRGAGLGMMTIASICAMSGIVVASMELTGLSYRLSFVLVDLAGDNLLLLLIVTAAASLVLGLNLPTSACYILLALLVAPALVQAGLSEMSAHFFVFYFGVAALITPPVCTAAFVAAAIANADPMATGWTATRLGIATFVVPFIFAYRPELLMQGSIGSILLVTLLSMILVMALAAGLAGYLLKPLSIWWRILLILGAGVMLVPTTVTTITGMAIIAVPAVFQLLLPSIRFQKERSAP